MPKKTKARKRTTKPKRKQLAKLKCPPHVRHSRKEFDSAFTGAFMNLASILINAYCPDLSTFKPGTVKPAGLLINDSNTIDLISDRDFTKENHGRDQAED